jgi:hypothetical protein
MADLGKRGTARLFTIKLRLINAFDPSKGEKRQDPEVLDVTGSRVKRWAKGIRQSSQTARR